jgi:phosphonoacetate hydrolase
MQGVKSAMLTCKRKTLELFHDNIEIGIAAEDASQEYKNRYGEPASIYSREINYWLWKVTVDLLKTRPDIGVFYVHITDYPMHAWGPEQGESQKHLQTLDTLIGEARDAAPDAAFFFTADHGMNYKKRCWDLKRVCEERGSPVRFVLSPERDYYVKHHRNFTGCSWIWLNNPDDIGKVMEILQGLEGVEEIISKEEAASRFHLKSERIGDLTVTGDQDTMFGEMETAYEDLPPTYRAHGSFYEMRLPLIIWNYHGELSPADEFRVNFDLTRMLYR